MMMDPTVENDGTAFICPECSFSGSNLLALISHLNEAHGEETGIKSITPAKFSSSTGSIEKRSRRKPAFSHQIVSQASRQSPTLYKQQSQSTSGIDSSDHWTNITNTNEDGNFPSIIGDENTNINQNSKLSTSMTMATKRSPNVLHSILSHQRPIAPKNESSITTKISSDTNSLSGCSLDETLAFYSSSNASMGTFRKNFQCRLCRLTYKNFHDCTAHIRKKHEIGHVQAGRYVDKLDSDVPLPPSATGHYKVRAKSKSLVGQNETSFLISTTNVKIEETKRQFQCDSCSFTSQSSKNLSEHQRAIHSNNRMSDENLDQERYAEFLIDPIRAFGEVIESIETNLNEEEPINDNDEILIQADEDDDEDDEAEALWKYQEEINETSENESMILNSNHVQTFKKFQCPHCDHSAPTLTKLKLHVATHINIKPFMCSICGWRANLRWYIQCHAKKRHPNVQCDVLQLSNEEAEQTIDAYMKERGLENKSNGHAIDSKHRYQCSLCPFRSTHPKYFEQHMSTNHPTKSLTKTINRKQAIAAMKSHSTNEIETTSYSKFFIQPPSMVENKTPALYNRSSLIQSDGSIILPDRSAIVYPNFSSHANFNPNRLFYCALCYRGYRWRYDVKRHHKTMHETPEDEAAMGLSMSPKSIKRRNKEFNRNFRYLEYVPQLDGLISASMSSVHHSIALKSIDRPMIDEITDDETPFRSTTTNIDDHRTVDVTEDEAAALLMIESDKSDQSSLIVQDHHNEDGVIIFDEDRPKISKEKSPSISFDLNKSNNSRSSTGFKPYRCPYCFYRTNWRTDSLRHIRARHKIEPTHDGYYELSAEEAERTYAEYERTFGFVVSKKVLGRFTNFTQIEWKDLQRSIWDKIKDKPGYEQIILDRLRPDDSPKMSTTSNVIVVAPPLPKPKPVVNVKPKRMFACVDCAFQTSLLTILEKHQCNSKENNRIGEAHGRVLVTFYNCSVCSYRTIDRNFARQHVHLHLTTPTKQFFFCSFCGWNHSNRTNIIRHIVRNHPKENISIRTKICRKNSSADFSIRQVQLRRSFVANHSNDLRHFYCRDCPQISTSIFEHDHHQSCHQVEHPNEYFRCEFCSFGSPSFLYLRQHRLLHSKNNRHCDVRNLRHLSISTIYKESLGKFRRYHCRFCVNFNSNHSTDVLEHIQKIHLGNSNQNDEDLLIGSEMIKEILSFGVEKQEMDTN